MTPNKLLVCLLMGMLMTSSMASVLMSSSQTAEPSAEETTEPSGEEATKPIDDTGTEEQTSATDPPPTAKPEKVPVRGYDRIDKMELKTAAQLTNFFLDSILQPGDVPDSVLAFANKSIQAPEEVTTDELVELLSSSDYILYYLGYSILAVISVLLLLCMPLTGLCTCCCRTAGKCGGKTHPRDEKNSECRRSCCGTLLLLVVGALTAGSVFMFASSFAIHDLLTAQDQTVFDNVAGAFDTFEMYLDTTVDEIDQATKGNFDESTEVIDAQLNSLASGAFAVIEDETKAKFYLEQLIDATNSFPSLLAQLELADTLIADLHTKNQDLETQLEQIRSDISGELASCSDPQCDEIEAELGNLTVSNNFSAMDFSPEITVLQTIIDEDLPAMLNAGLQKYNEIESDIEAAVNDEIDGSRDQIDQVGQDIDNAVSDIRREVENLNISDVSNDVRNLTTNAEVQEVSDYVFYVLIGLSSLVAFIVLCFLLGLLHGACCRRAHADSGDSCCTRKCGATWILTGISLTFIFYFVLGLVALVCMLVGGAFHTEVCRYVVDPASASPDVLSLVNTAVNTHVIKPSDPSEAIDIVDIYRNCQENEPLYQAVDFEALLDVDLDAILDTAEINKTLEDLKSITIEIETPEIISDALETELTTASDAIYNIGVNAQRYGDAIQPSAVLLDVEKFISQIEPIPELSTQVQQLEEQIANIDEIENDTANLTATLEQIQALCGSMSIADWVNELKDAEEMIDVNGSAIISNYVNTTADEIIREVSVLTSTIETELKHEVGQCFPVYSAYVQLVDTACVDAGYALNAFWFGLGWCLFFLLWAIIIGFQLAGLYRKTKPYKKPSAGPRTKPKPSKRQVYDAYEGDEEIGPVPQTSTQVLYRPGSPGMPPADNPVYYTEVTPLTPLDRRLTKNSGAVMVFPTAPPPYNAHKQHKPYYTEVHRV